MSKLERLKTRSVSVKRPAPLGACSKVACHGMVCFQDFETLDLEDFRHNFVNITGLRLVDREDPVIRDTLHQMQLHQQHTGTRLLNDSKQLIIKVCLLSVTRFAATWTSLSVASTLFRASVPITCSYLALPLSLIHISEPTRPY